MGSAYKAFNAVFTEQHLKSLFEEKIQNRASVGLDWVTVGAFRERLDSEVDLIVRKCRAGTYHFTHYRELLISKGPNKLPRCISIPTVRDKLVLLALNEVLKRVYGLDIVTQTPQIVISQIQKEIENNIFDSYVKYDISSFYASVDHDKLLSMLYRRIRKKQVLSLIVGAITTATVAPNGPSAKAPRGRGLPEGLTISNSLANLYLMDMDRKYQNAPASTFRYWRYVDDILVLTSAAGRLHITENIGLDLKALGLSAAEGKTTDGPLEAGFDYLGYYIKGSCFSVRQNSIVKLERSIEDIFRHYKLSRPGNIEYLQWRVNLRVTGFILDNSKMGWVFFYSQINDTKCLYHLDWFISKLAERYNVRSAKFKRFSRAYMEIRNAWHTTTYIPNLDTISIDEKRKIVQDVYGQNTENLDNDAVERCFRRIMARELKNIQKDVQPFS